ncbi:MAG: sulfatase-like hydrolase/transferase [Candidatus Latescibacteria bacterium]|nr:sulfatase-like hydrolase/transferase [Candidatus Latescibacterota bacterium]
MSKKRPNILFVFSDQQRYSAMGANGNNAVRTPMLDAMAAEGMVCDTCISNHPLCSPYRALLLTGQYGWRNGVIDNEYRPRRAIPTLPGLLRQGGYETAHIGTFHLGRGPYPEVDRYGIDYLAALHDGPGFFDRSYWENETGPTTYEGWAPQTETGLTIKFVEQHLAKRAADPFAVFLSWRPPHWPYPQYPEEFGGYDPAAMDLPGNVPPQMADFARREMADYYGCCTGLDAQMGRLLAALDELGVADDTIVCYTSDHGDHLSSHGYGKPFDNWMHHSMRASKATPYEESCHVPFIVRWPGVTPANSRSDAFLGAIDLVPSLLGACGLEIPACMQGRDLSPVWRGGQVPPDPEHAPGGSESAYLMNMAHGWPDRSGWVGRWRGVRTQRYTYARWYHNERGPWLFDRETDPLEMTNLAELNEARPVVEEMEERLHRWMEASGDPFEYGKRGPRGFLDVGQQWADAEKWKDWGTS